MNIRRWKLWGLDNAMIQDVDGQGEWVLASEHESALAAARKEAEGYRELIREALPVISEHECGWDCDIVPELPVCTIPDLAVRIRAALNGGS